MIRYSMYKTSQGVLGFTDTTISSEAAIKGVAIAISFNDIPSMKEIHFRILDLIHTQHPGLPVTVQYPQGYSTNYRCSSLEACEKEFEVPIETLNYWYYGEQRFAGFFLDGIRYEQGNYYSGFPVKAENFSDFGKNQIFILNHSRINKDSVKLINDLLVDILKEKGIEETTTSFFAPLSKVNNNTELKFKSTSINFFFGSLNIPYPRDRERLDSSIPLPNVSQRNVYGNLNTTKHEGSTPATFKINGFTQNNIMFSIGENKKDNIRFFFNPHLGKIRPRDIPWLRDIFTQAIESFIVYREKKEEVVSSYLPPRNNCSLVFNYNYSLDNIEEIKDKMTTAFAFINADTFQTATIREKFHIVFSSPCVYLLGKYTNSYLAKSIIFNLGDKETPNVDLNDMGINSGPMKLFTSNGKIVKIASNYATIWLLPFKAACLTGNMKETTIDGSGRVACLIGLMQKFPQLAEYAKISSFNVGSLIGYNGTIERRNTLLYPARKVLNIISPYTSPNGINDRIIIPMDKLPMDASRLILDRQSSALIGYRMDTGGDVLLINMGVEQVTNQIGTLLEKLGETDLSARPRYQAALYHNICHNVTHNGGNISAEGAPAMDYWYDQLRASMTAQLESVADSPELVEKLRTLDTALKACGDGWKIMRVGNHIMLYLFLRNIWIREGSRSYFIGNYTVDIDLTNPVDPRCYGGVYTSARYPHPHVSSRVCLGTAQNPYYEYTQQRNLVGLHGLFRALLEVYNSGSPYIVLPNFLYKECSKCGFGGISRFWGGNFYCDKCYPSDIKHSVYWKELPKELRVPMVRERI